MKQLRKNMEQKKGFTKTSPKSKRVRFEQRQLTGDDLLWYGK
jgi:hypothetical protein